MLVEPIRDYTENVVIIDYGMSNLFSVVNALSALGCEAIVSSRPADVMTADRVILPGVGAFGLGMQSLRNRGLVEALIEVAPMGKPLLGICLGMQLLGTESFEHGHHEGMNLIPGTVRRLPSGQGCRIPHIGWNSVASKADSILHNGIAVPSDFYFVHSFYFDAVLADDVSGWCEYGTMFAASIQRGVIMGVQFHPEKSHRAGLTILKNFLLCQPCSR
jgi:glutamine amidotransferase